MNKTLQILLWPALAILGAFSFAAIALNRGESVSAAWLVTAALCVFFIAYRFYSKFIAEKVLQLDDSRMTPAVRHHDGVDFVPTNKHVLYGHHFAAIAGAGPLVGPVLAAQWGYLPGTIWLLAGVVFAGAVQDFVVLFCSIRRDGRSLGEMVKMEMGPAAGAIALVGTLAIMIIILAALGLIVVKALGESPWGTFTVAVTIPLAMAMGIYMRYIRPGKILEASAFGVVVLLLTIWYGQYVSHSPTLGPLLTYSAPQLAWAVIAYGAIASVLPVWLLLAPRDYLSTFLKIGVLAALAIGIYIVQPELRMPATTRFIDGTGPVVSGSLFPFLFITIACGSVSGFHALISSGTTPKMIEREGQARYIGYGGMLTESFVAVMALVAASVLDPGIYFAMNVPAAVIGPTVDTAARVISEWGWTITPELISQTAKEVGEHTILHRAGGAPTLAVGIAQIMAQVFGRQGDGSAVVPLRDPVRGAFHPHRGRRGHACRALHDPGSAWPRVRAARPHRLDPRQHRRHPPVRVRMGLLRVPGHGRSPGRREHDLAAVRHRQPDARRHRAAAGHRGAHQNEAREVHLGHPRADGVAAGVHAFGGVAEGAVERSDDRFPRPRQQVQRGGSGRYPDRSREDHRRNAAGRVQ
jgi:carbon starvation protein